MDFEQIPHDIPGDSLFSCYVQAWTNKIEAAQRVRNRWEKSVEEIMMFYNRSAAAMFDVNYAKKFWRGKITPRFRVSINLAYEYVAVMLPHLLWERPHRNVAVHRPMDLPQEAFGQDEMGQMLFQQASMEQSGMAATAKLAATLMQNWLNYTAIEMPQGLLWHSTLATLDALLKGRGCLWTRPYTFPGSQRVITGCFREPPESLLIDPDAKTLADARWISLKHVDPYYEVERRFRLPKDSLRRRGTLQSSWTSSENLVSGDPQYVHKFDGETNDTIVWYEVWSKCGCGTRGVEMYEPVKLHLEELVGDFAYMAVSPSVPWPLNCPVDKLDNASSDEVRECFRWPIESFWKDDRWPVEIMDFYPNNDDKDEGAAWPIPPLEPALGEIKLLNILIPFLVNRVWMSSRDFWAVLGPHLQHYKQYLDNGDDQIVIPTPAMADDVRKILTVIQQPETRRDMWELIGLVTQLFRERVGLPRGMYGMNEDGTQSRSAEDAISKSNEREKRPSFMQKKMVTWMAKCAESESIVARRFVRGEHMRDRIGPTMSGFWDQLVASDDAEAVVRQLQYTIDAASIRRPNRERDTADFQQAMQYFLSLIASMGQATGDFTAVNGIIEKWGELHDQDVSHMLVQPPQPDPQAQQQAAEQAELERAKLEADLQGKQIDVETKMLEGQIKQQVAEADMQRKAVETELDAVAREQQLRFDARKATLDLQVTQGKGLQELLMDRAKFGQQAQQTAVMGAIKAVTAAKQGNGKAK